jgi:hypothetical protein
MDWHLHSLLNSHSCNTVLHSGSSAFNLHSEQQHETLVFEYIDNVVIIRSAVAGRLRSTQFADAVVVWELHHQFSQILRV